MEGLAILVKNFIILGKSEEKYYGYKTQDKKTCEENLSWVTKKKGSQLEEKQERKVGRGNGHQKSIEKKLTESRNLVNPRSSSFGLYKKNLALQR